MKFKDLPEDIENIIMRRCHELSSIAYRRDIVEIHNSKKYIDIYRTCYSFFIYSDSLSDIKLVKDVHQILMNLRTINTLRRLRAGCSCESECKCSNHSAQEHLSCLKMVQKFNRVCGDRVVKM